MQLPAKIGKNWVAPNQSLQVKREPLRQQTIAVGEINMRQLMNDSGLALNHSARGKFHFSGMPPKPAQECGKLCTCRKC
jgi:hypothetical protein